MLKVDITSTPALMETLFRMVDEGFTGPVNLQLLDAVSDDYTALELFDVIKLFSKNLDLHVTLLSGNSGQALVVAGAVPQEKRFVTETGIFLFKKGENWGQGDYKQLKIAAEAMEEHYKRMISVLDSNYVRPKGVSFDVLFTEQTVVRADELVAFGFQKIGG